LVRGCWRGVIGSPQGLRSYLLTGEHILWNGKPKQGIQFQSSDAFLIPFSLLWGGFAIFWNFSVWEADAPSFFRLWGLPFLFIGIYLIFGRFLHDAYIRTHIYYAVTNQRVLVYNGGMGKSLKSLDIASLPTLDLTERRNRSGTISFEPSSSLFDSFYGWNSFRAWVPTLGGSVRFLDIPDARKVYEIIRRQFPRP